MYALVESVIVSSRADSLGSRKNEYNQVRIRHELYGLQVTLIQLGQTTAPAAAPSARARDLRSRFDAVSRLLYPLSFLFFVGTYDEM